MLILLMQTLVLAQASEWDCRNWIQEYDQLAAQVQYEESGQQFRDCMAARGPGSGGVCAAASSGQSFGNAAAAAMGVSPRQRLNELDSAIRSGCYSN